MNVGRFAELLVDSFGDAAAELLAHLRDDGPAERLAWADSISLPPKRCPLRPTCRRSGSDDLFASGDTVHVQWGERAPSGTASHSA